MIKYRLAKAVDVSGISLLRYRLYADDDEATIPQRTYIETCKKSLLQGIREGNWLHFIATEDQEVVGNISLHLITHLPRPYKDKKFIGYLTNAYVKPEFRNKKVGTKLVKNLLTHAKKIGCESVFVWPSDKSIRFYSRAGFKNTELCEIRFKMEEK